MFSGNPFSGAQAGAMGGSSGGFGGMNMGGMGNGIQGILSGLFGDSGAPYEDAMDQYREWGKRGEDVQNPFLRAGQGAIPDFQKWLGGMQDPSGFINNLMGKYQESPWAKYQQDQAMRGAQNMGSANGLTGSTPMGQFMQQNASNIGSQDMNQWLQHVLGINTQYGAGQAGLMQGGQKAANQLTGMFGDMGRQMGAGAYGSRMGENQDRNNLWGGLFNTGMAIAGL